MTSKRKINQRNKVKFIHSHSKTSLAMGLSDEDCKKVLEEITSYDNLMSKSQLIEAIWNSNLTNEQVIFALMQLGRADEALRLIEKMKKSEVKMGVMKIDENGIQELKNIDLPEDIKRQMLDFARKLDDKFGK